jgi:hypothetical protein
VLHCNAGLAPELGWLATAGGREHTRQDLLTVKHLQGQRSHTLSNLNNRSKGEPLRALVNCSCSKLVASFACIVPSGEVTWTYPVEQLAVRRCQ